MAQYSVLSLQEIQNIAADYGILSVTEFKLLKGGSENTNYLVSAETGKYVVSICEQKSIREAQELAQLLTHLEKHNFNTSQVIQNSQKEAIGIWQEKPFMIKAFIEGEILEDLSPHLLECIGKEMGRLHKIQAPAYLPKTINYGIERFREVETYALNSSFDLWLKEIEAYVKQRISADLPKALIHSDVFFNNVIIGENRTRATIMDFEEATYYYRIFDIGMALIGLCSESQILNLEKVKDLLRGYVSEIVLSQTETLSLKAFTIYAAAAMSFWRHKNFNFTKPNPKMFDHYLALKNMADHVKSLPEDCFVKLL